MRFHSTPESVLNGEITVLAVIECVASVALYLVLGFYLGTLRYLAWAVVVAPLMLFRTKRSVEWGLDSYSKYCNAMVSDDPDYYDARFALWREVYIFRFRNPLKVWLSIAALGLGGALVRAVSPLYWFLRRPLEALKEAPFNWQRQSLCTDFCFPPEIIPDETFTPRGGITSSEIGEYFKKVFINKDIWD